MKPKSLSPSRPNNVQIPINSYNPKDSDSISKMKVLKFGGTSVGSSASLQNVRNIIEGDPEPKIVVVSALGGLTDKLIATARKAAGGDESYMSDITQMVDRHHAIIDDVIAEARQASVLNKVDALLEELTNLYKGVSLIRHISERTMDLIVSFGERMSSVIVANMLSEAEHHDSLGFVKTERWFNKNIADRELTERLIKEEFPMPLCRNVVVGGFISKDRDSGEVTNLGRGGSDYTAALIAAAIDAEELQIWTDVDGFLTADPRIVTGALFIPEMSFIESMELCSYGAKVIYPPTIYPVFHKNIPIRILNTFRPKGNGTLITDSPKGEKVAVRGISSMKTTSMLTVRGELASDVAVVNTRTFNALSKKGINILMVSGQRDFSFSFIVQTQEAVEALRCLLDEFAPEIQQGDLKGVELLRDVSVIAIVGENMREHGDFLPSLVSVLEGKGIRVSAYSEKTSETTAAIAVELNDADNALRTIHKLCFES